MEATRLANIWANKRYEENDRIYYAFSEAALKAFTQKVINECIWGFGQTRTEPSLEKYLQQRLGVYDGKS